MEVLNKLLLSVYSFLTPLQVDAALDYRAAVLGFNGTSTIATMSAFASSGMMNNGFTM
jgi:hypothetical protein